MLADNVVLATACQIPPTNEYHKIARFSRSHIFQGHIYVTAVTVTIAIKIDFGTRVVFFSLLSEHNERKLIFILAEKRQNEFHSLSCVRSRPNVVFRCVTLIPR